MEIVCVGQKPTHPNKKSIFLAGPSPRRRKDYSWRPEAIEALSTLGFYGVVFIPLKTPQGGWLGDDRLQNTWELDHLEAATVIAFWVPRDLVCLPGFTTNVEYGLFARSGKVILGYPEGAPKTTYLKLVAERFGIPVYHSLNETITAAVGKINQQ